MSSAQFSIFNPVVASGYSDNTALLPMASQEPKMFTLSDILDIAVKIEENGEAYYRRALASVSDPDLVQMLQWLAEQEADHARQFADMRTRIEIPTEEDPRLEGIGRALLREAVSEKGFSLDETEATDISRVKTLIDLSITFEQDTVAFYELLRPFVDNAQDRQILDDIIAQEKDHIEKFRSFLASRPPDVNPHGDTTSGGQDSLAKVS